MNAPLCWSPLQCFGQQEADINPSLHPKSEQVSCVAFDERGDHLAAGDNSGRVVLWEKEDQPRARPRGRAPAAGYRFLCEFQGHNPEFDCLRSVEIEARVNQVHWLRRPADGRFLLCGNDKSVKLWKIYDKDFKLAVPEPRGNAQGAVVVPQLRQVETAVVARIRGWYANAHDSAIHSCSPCSDGETFFSADDLRVHVWHIDVPHRCTNVVDLCRNRSEVQKEVMTCAVYHPAACSEFAYATSLGSVNVCDMRASLHCSPARVFRNAEPAHTIFTPLLASVSDVKYNPRNPRLLVSRDFMTLKVWDVAMERGPVTTIRVHEHMRSHLVALYENESLFDRFECAWSGDGTRLLTGSYGFTAHSWDLHGGSHTTLETSTRFRRRKSKKQRLEPHHDPMDTTKKTLHVAWHPLSYVTAACTRSNLYLYAGEILGDGQN